MNCSLAFAMWNAGAKWMKETTAYSINLCQLLLLRSGRSTRTHVNGLERSIFWVPAKRTNRWDKYFPSYFLQNYTCKLIPLGYRWCNRFRVPHCIVISIYLFLTVFWLVHWWSSSFLKYNRKYVSRGHLASMRSEHCAAMWLLATVFVANPQEAALNWIRLWNGSAHH